MTIFEKLAQNTIPENEQIVVDLFRRFIGDTVELNTLKEVQENSDLELYQALVLTMNEINQTLSAAPNFEELQKIPDANTLFVGALLTVLTSKGIISARNTLNYRDAGGVTVQDYDTYGRYINYFNVLINKYYKALQTWNTRLNVEACYGGINSDYMDSGRFVW